MELLLRARAELTDLRNRFYALLEPEKALAAKVEEVVHHAVVEIEALGARIGNFEARVKAFEDTVEARVHDELVKLGLAQPKPPADPVPPMPAVESAAAPTPVPSVEEVRAELEKVPAAPSITVIPLTDVKAAESAEVRDGA